MLATNLISSKVLAAILEDLEDAGDVLENLKDAGGDTRGTLRRRSKAENLKDAGGELKGLRDDGDTRGAALVPASA